MTAIELGCPYFLYAPDATNYVAINVPADANFVGYMQDITGLDDSEVRENAQSMVAGDGGYHGRFWRGRRPWTITGFIMPTFPVSARSAAQGKINNILGQCLSADGYLMWQPSDGIQKQVSFRKQQPSRFTKGQSNVERLFQIACVTANFRIISSTTKNILGTGVSPKTIQWAVNNGDADALPKFTVTGPANSPIIIKNNQTNKQIEIDVNVAAATTLIVDLTGTYPTVMNNGVNAYGGVNPLQTDWGIAVAPPIIAGASGNSFTLTAAGTTTATGLRVDWNDSYN